MWEVVQYYCNQLKLRQCRNGGKDKQGYKPVVACTFLNLRMAFKLLAAERQVHNEVEFICGKKHVLIVDDLQQITAHMGEMSKACAMSSLRKSFADVINPKK